MGVMVVDMNFNRLVSTDTSELLLPTMGASNRAVPGGRQTASREGMEVVVGSHLREAI